METAEQTDVLVVGAGQSGLALGYHLRRRGREVLLVDRNDRIGDSWRTRWDSLKLYSPASRDGLPGMPFPAGPRSYPTKDEMADYLEAYAARHELPVRLGAAVEELTQEEGRFVARIGESRIEADTVVIASGVFEKPYVPPFADQLDPTITQLHSSAYRNLSQLQDGPVLVVGASHSGADIAYEAAVGHEVVLSGRDTGQLPASIESRRGRALFGRCGRTSGTVGRRCSATGGRICAQRASSGCSNGPSVSRTGCPSSTADGCPTSGTSSGARASVRTSAGSDCRWRSAKTAIRCSTAA
jgi:glycine/D-amino acid oxidase-like deaminating enzyme